MLPIIYEFVKFFSFIFVLSGLTCLFNGLYYLAFLQLASFLIVRGIDSDWAFDTLKFKNHNSIVILITFAMIFINIAAIYTNMQNSPLFIRATENQKRAYIEYENNLFSKLRECTTLHNEALIKKEDYLEISNSEEEYINAMCSDTIVNLEQMQIPYNDVPEIVISLMGDLKTNIKYISLNLSNYKYKYTKSYNENINTLLKMNLHDTFGTIQTIRKMLRLSPEIEEGKKNIVKLEES